MSRSPFPLLRGRGRPAGCARCRRFRPFLCEDPAPIRFGWVGVFPYGGCCFPFSLPCRRVVPFLRPLSLRGAVGAAPVFWLPLQGSCRRSRLRGSHHMGGVELQSCGTGVYPSVSLAVDSSPARGACSSGAVTPFLRLLWCTLRVGVVGVLSLSVPLLGLSVPSVGLSVPSREGSG